MKDFQYNSLNREAIKMRLFQIGSISNVYKPVKDGEDKLNNDIIIYKRVGETILARHFESTTENDVDQNSGTWNKVNPSFILPYDSIIEDDCHVFYQGTEYQIETTEERGNHIDANSKEVETLSAENPSVTAVDEDGNALTLPVEQ